VRLVRFFGTSNRICHRWPSDRTVGGAGHPIQSSLLSMADEACDLVEETAFRNDFRGLDPSIYADYGWEHDGSTRRNLHMTQGLLSELNDGV